MSTSVTATATVAPAVPPPRTLLGPGPASVHPEVLAAHARTLVGSDDPWWEARVGELTTMLRAVLRTSNAATTVVPGTVTLALDAVLADLVGPGDTAIVGVGGGDGERLADAAARAGADVVRLEVPWGHAVPLDRIAAAVAAHPDARLVGLVHAETSTGVLQPLAEVGSLLRDSAPLFLVDSAAGLGGIPLETDAWGCDVVVAGTGHCLGVPPGSAPITMSPDAVIAARARRASVRPRGLDAVLRSDGPASAPHVAPTPAVMGLHEGLRRVLGEGLEVRWARHAEVGELFQSHIEDRDATVLAPVDRRVPHLTWFAWPPGTDGRELRVRLRDAHGIEVGLGRDHVAGPGDRPGATWRVGLMAEGATHATVDRLLDAIDELREG